MNRTNIPWVRNPDNSQGWTWNPIIGCSPASEGCLHCYAAAAAHKMAANPNARISAAYSGLTDDDGRWSAPPRLMRSRLTDPGRERKPAMIFVCSMADLFHEAVSFRWIREIMRIVELCPDHTFLLLTKRPRRMAEYFRTEQNRPMNCWLGVTAENQARLDERLPVLMNLWAPVRFVSVEPMLGPVRLPPRMSPDWIIAGPENGAGARPCDPDWISDLYAQCQDRGVAFFDKRTEQPITQTVPVEGVR